MDNISLKCHARYVNHISIIYDHTKVTPTQIRNTANSIHSELKFSLMQEIETNICFLNLLIRRTQDFDNNIYRKKTPNIC